MTMTQNRLVNLSILSIEKKIAADIAKVISPRLFANLQNQKLEGLNFKISCSIVSYLKS